MLTRRILQMAAASVAVVGCTAESQGPVVDEPPGAVELLVGELNCAEAGRGLGRGLGDRELALDGAPGTFALDDLNRVTVTGDDHAIDFSSSVGVDAVLVRGGRTTRVYAYDGEARRDEALTAAPMFRSGETRAITGVTFCYDHELAVSLTATPRLQRTRRWAIEVVPVHETLNMVVGKVAHPRFEVTAAPSGWADLRYSASGRVVLANPAPEPAEVVAFGPPAPEPIEGIVRDLPPLAPVKVSCPAPVPFFVPAFGEVACDVSTGAVDGRPHTLAVAARTAGPVGPGAATLAIDFEDPQLIDHDARVWVYSKVAGYLGVAEETQRFEYQVELGPYAWSSVGWYRADAMLIGLDTGHAFEGSGWLRVVVLPNPHHE